MLGKFIGTIAAFGIYGAALTFYYPTATVATGEIAAHQFDNSDTSAVAVPVATSFVNGIESSITFALIVVLLMIWAKPIGKFINKMTER